MKNIIYILICSLGILSCTKEFDEMNIDPNNPVSATSSSILLQAQRTITHTLLDDNDVFSVLGWTQYQGRNGYNEQTYDYNWNTDRIFNSVNLVLNDIELLRIQAIKQNHKNYEGIAMIMKVWIFANYTEMYGDVPYSEALKAFSDRLLYPKYDTQESIYKDLVLQLKEAEAKLDIDPSAARVDDGSDLFCQGNMLKWKKFANSLRARLYLRMSEADNAIAKAGLEEIFGDITTYPILEKNDDNVGVKFIEESSGVNTATFVQQSRSGTQRFAGDLIVDLLCANNDPRRTIMLNATQQSIDSVKAGKWTDYEYTGTPPNTLSPIVSFKESEVSMVGEAITFDFYRPIDIISYAEVLFIRAEAASKGYNVGGTAKEFYEAGIVASMNKWGVSDSTLIDQYIIENFAAYDASKAKEQIINQRYIEQFHQSLNTFAMIRRSSYPVLKWDAVGFAQDYGFPDRIPYSFNQKGERNFSDEGVVQNLWGNLWFAKGVTVNQNSSYTTPAIYKFKN
ncbi:SusD/RagB family nutrient-binding outer membrane lipoprotein [Polaribacter sp. Z014]|uniref:SusD/RagB family nutrient-binding outer membrane lipoprotein n=1 Tax=Polaribacter sp. Z014 TaxID=2927126 RepID=UPI0020201DCC|nr:SusD/RagB family nutrient-binding outer membrane lipoprotein [Polaribacter sp. Z014]MCL7764474.1 SusD/RagB family nutrient-binding outer membrane lipoprotein [Polaribacter sp. Z014]